MHETAVVTFLLTDIEASTRKWESMRDEMRASILLHDRLVSRAVHEHRGIVLNSHGEGDSFFAVFGLASDAIGAACDIQRDLEEQLWPYDLRLRVRIALHSGEAGGDYRGCAANRCARLRGLARGGQIVMSRVTADLAAGSLPPGAELVDLGQHRLRDLGWEQVVQLTVRDPNAARPPLPCTAVEHTVGELEPSVAAYYTGWGNYNRLLVGAVAPLDDAQLRLQAAPHLWSVRMLVNHIVGARAWWFHAWMGEGGPEFDAMEDFDEGEESERRTAAEIVEALEATWSLVDSCLKRWSAADLDVRFQRPVPNPAGERPWRDRRFIVWHVAEHDLHHGGELSFTLGMHGVPAIDL